MKRYWGSHPHPNGEPSKRLKRPKIADFSLDRENKDSWRQLDVQSGGMSRILELQPRVRH